MEDKKSLKLLLKISVGLIIFIISYSIYQNYENDKFWDKFWEEETVNSLEKAEQCAIGTWQFTQTDKEQIYVRWYKFDLKENKTFDSFEAFPRDGQWKYESKGVWSAGTDRYSNTGERYYYIELKYDKYGETKDYKLRFVISSCHWVDCKILSLLNNGRGFKGEINPWKD